jgi:5-dehydro-4-deoxyglucarate dehydratase
LCRLNPAVLEQLAERCPNLVGFKDGLGDIELMVSIRRRLGERLAYVCGLNAAEVSAGTRSQSLK